MSEQVVRIRGSAVEQQLAQGPTPEPAHVVHFFRDDGHLIASVVEFVRTGLERGDAAIVIATPDHLEALQAALIASCALAERARERGSFVLGEAGTTFSRFAPEQVIDASAFERIIGELIERARQAASSGRVRVYGEMVDLLWRSGERAAVFRLEELWGRLVDETGIELLCGYMLDGFAGAEHIAAFSQVCASHSHIVPSPGFARASDTQKVRAFAELEQRASALEAEIERRKHAELVREQLFRAERAARDRTLRLQRVTAALSEVLTESDIASVGLQAVAEAIGADVSSLSRLSPDGREVETTMFSGLLPEAMQAVRRLPLEARVAAAVDAIRTGSAVVVETPEQLEQMYPEMAQRGPYRGGTRASVPLVVRGRAVGALNVGFSEWRQLSSDERDFAVTVAEQCAQALERVELYQSERKARHDAERRRLETELLFDLSRAINCALSLEQVYEPALDGLCSVLEVERAAVLLYDDAGLMRFRAWRGLSEAYRNAVEGHSPWSREDRDPRPVFVDDAQGDPALLAYRPLLQAEGIGALGFIPLLDQHGLLGKLMIYSRSPRAFSERDERLAWTVAAQLAQAVERARLFDLEKKARAQAEAAEQRTAFLLEASGLLSESLDFQHALNRLAWLAVPRIADCCGVEIAVQANQAVEQLAVAHVDSAKLELARELRRRYPPDPDAREGTPNVLRTGVAELYERIEDTALVAAARDPEHLRMLRELGLRSLMIVPMSARGRTFGAIVFASAESGRRYGAADLELADLLGRRAGIAIDNALLYAAAADEARAREHVLAVVSHDLRNPLAAILMNVGSVLRLEVADKTGLRMRKSVEAIQRSAERMSRMIGDLLDYASIQAGRFAIEPRPCAPGEIVHATVEMFTALAHDRDLRLETLVTDELPEVLWDQDRVIQALGNLVSNAVKVTAAGSTVSVGARVEGARVVLFVQDAGPGIGADELPRLFQRYYRSEKAPYTGTGLGLSIAKGIVDAHAGRIWVDSTPGVGSRFSISIPVTGVRPS